MQMLHVTKSNMRGWNGAQKGERIWVNKHQTSTALSGFPSWEHTHAPKWKLKENWLLQS